MLAGRADDVAGRRPGDAVVGVDLDAAHLMGLDEQRVTEVTERRRVVAGALRSDAQALAPPRTAATTWSPIPGDGETAAGR